MPIDEKARNIAANRIADMVKAGGYSATCIAHACINAYLEATKAEQAPCGDVVKLVEDAITAAPINRDAARPFRLKAEAAIQVLRSAIIEDPKVIIQNDRICVAGKWYVPVEGEGDPYKNVPKSEFTDEEGRLWKLVDHGYVTPADLRLHLRLGVKFPTVDQASYDDAHGIYEDASVEQPTSSCSKDDLDHVIHVSHNGQTCVICDKAM